MMKRFLSIVPVLLFILLNSCGIPVPASVGTAVAQTQTAGIWTPTITSTPDPDEPQIVMWLNETLLSADPLEQTLDAKYQVVDVLFPTAPDIASAVFRVDIRCECSTNTQCCIPERMFVMIMRAMEKYPEKIIEQVADRASSVQVTCYDHMTLIGTMIATWLDVKSYLRKQITGYQLGARVIKFPPP